ncbi:Uncharacterized protein DBV15_07598 [Temnothorax longispinosus]|uniref:Uncharacterized protein n=1 Tax=Temnothorax longispinosus TaxID=300112 RepID=A0A4S2L5F1_9HYME|nr:Uncharacterized protein DBV15_07598 [Temnothorax longispinosus]
MVRVCDEKHQEAEEKETGGRGSVPLSAALGWLVTPPCAGSGGRSRCWKVVPDEKPSRRTLILEGLDAPSSTLQRGFNPRDPRNNHPALVHPFACRSLLRMVPSTVWPERDNSTSLTPTIANEKDIPAPKGSQREHAGNSKRTFSTQVQHYRYRLPSSESK